jgi:hypothetical protein
MTIDAGIDDSGVAAQLRAMVITELRDFGPEVTEAELTAVATVPYAGDVHAYLAEVLPVLSAALSLAAQPHLDAMRAELEAYRAETAAFEAAIARAHCEFEEFRLLETPSTIH